MQINNTAFLIITNIVYLEDHASITLTLYMSTSQVTIKDLAKKLGISASTVSRALHNHPDISLETRLRVQALAEELHYTPNVIAQNLRTKKTKTIGVVVPEIVHFFFSTVILGIEEIAYNAGYSVMFCQSAESYEREKKDIQALINHRIDGLLVSFSKETDNFEHLKEVASNIPVVLFDRETDDLDVSKVVVDDYLGAMQATEHLLDQGCQRIAHLAGPENLSVGAMRKKGYERAIIDNGLSLKSEYLIPCFSGTIEEGQICMQRLLALSEPPDAVFAHNDTSAYGAMQAIKEHGLNIPNDIAVVGFSDWRFSSLINPKLSSISQPGEQMGREATKLLINEINSDSTSTSRLKKVLKTELIVRESSQKMKKK